MSTIVTRTEPDGQEVRYVCHRKVVTLSSGPVEVHYFTHADPQQRPALTPMIHESVRGHMPLGMAAVVTGELIRQGMLQPIEAAAQVADLKIQTEGRSPSEHEELTREILAAFLWSLTE